MDVSTGAQNVTVSLEATDDLSGVSSIVVSFLDSSGGSIVPMDFGGAGNTLPRIAGDANSGTCEGTLIIPQYWPAGNWRARVTVTDGTNRSIKYDRVLEEPFPVLGSDLLTIQNSGTGPAAPFGDTELGPTAAPGLAVTADTTPPVITGLTVTPGVADVSTDLVNVTVEVDFADDLSGANYASVFLRSRHGIFVATNLPAGPTPGFAYPNPAPLILSAGNVLAGTYRGTIAIPAGTAPEVIPVMVRLSDAAGRTVTYGSEPGETSLPGGVDHDLTIINRNSTSVAKLGLWAAGLGLTGPDAAPAANPTGDRSDNLLKWAFNIDPTAPSAALLFPGTGTSGLPVDEVIFDGPNSIYRLEYLRRVGSGLIYTPAATSVLGTWPPISSQPIITPIDVNWERVEVEYPSTATSSTPCTPDWRSLSREEIEKDVGVPGGGGGTREANSEDFEGRLLRGGRIIDSGMSDNRLELVDTTPRDCPWVAAVCELRQHFVRRGVPFAVATLRVDKQVGIDRDHLSQITPRASPLRTDKSRRGSRPNLCP